MPGKCHFKEEWLKDAELKMWLRRIEGNQQKAQCVLCQSTFDISGSGISQVKTHAKGKNHKALLEPLLHRTQKMLPCNASFSAKPMINDTTTTQETNVSNPCCNDSIPTQAVPSIPAVEMNTPNETRNSAGSFFIKDEVTKSEILWVLAKIRFHISNRTAGNLTDMFSVLFHDSFIAKGFQLHKDKIGYLVTFGTGPYFQDCLVDCLQKLDFFTLSFDESLNKIAQASQMDFIVRYWNDEKNLVNCRYLTSAFLKAATAKDLSDACNSTLLSLGLTLHQVAQIATDGPNVNLKFHKDLHEYLIKCYSELGLRKSLPLDTGTCTLHIVHNAFKTAVKKNDWQETINFLISSYRLFKNHPVRRGAYILHTGSSVFPLKFCSHRWLENRDVLLRMIDILPFLQKYVDAVKKEPPQSYYFENVKEMLKDKFLEARLIFLLSINTEFHDFLVTFQDEKPMFPFLYVQLFNLVKSIGKRFLEHAFIKNASNNDLLTLDLNNNALLKAVGKINLGFGLHDILNTEDKKNKIKELDRVKFYEECQKFLKLLFVTCRTKLPLKNKIVRGATCLSPEIITNEIVRTRRINILLQELVSFKHLTPCEAEVIVKNYEDFCSSPITVSKCASFNWRKDRLDQFIFSIIDIGNFDFHTLFLNFVKKILLLFHGNSDVERGYSINDECLIENMMNESLIAQRSTYSALNGIELKSFVVSKKLVQYAKNASAKRQEHLKLKKREEESQVNERKRLAKELFELEIKKRKIEETRKEELLIIEKDAQILKKKINISYK